MTPKQEETLRAYLQEAILPLIEEVLVKKLGQAMTFAKEELLKREWVGLTLERKMDMAESYFTDEWAINRAIQMLSGCEAALRSENA